MPLVAADAPDRPHPAKEVADGEQEKQSKHEKRGKKTQAPHVKDTPLAGDTP